jgi:hypothetical protein
MRNVVEPTSSAGRRGTGGVSVSIVVTTNRVARPTVGLL